ncbi:hypothetical protein G8764_22280 [Pseudomaricurvus alcaniphilus]|uniref:hypothetical protein n=1 Tax=Pseudomaricurvus alcaniphilus TaxID=1166482 RepID=UPI00140B5C2D|nr:hypothetical protein [Pseudomaricurvus alcaniphilus]NHN40024.1 hypothetical protein [Pseudomaricurvus alcaniphilus]
MTFKLDGNIEEVLIKTKATAGDHYRDDYGNDWVVHDDRDGLRLQKADNPDAWIPYWTALTIKLPGLQKTR